MSEPGDLDSRRCSDALNECMLLSAKSYTAVKCSFFLHQHWKEQVVHVISNENVFHPISKVCFRLLFLDQR